MPKTEISIGGRPLNQFRLKKGEFISFRDKGPNPDVTVKDGFEAVTADPRVGLYLKGNYLSRKII